MNNQSIGINHTGIWTAAQYAIDAGWDASCVEATARLGVSEADGEGLTPDQIGELLSYCQTHAWADALARIDGRIIAGSVVHYDDSMHLYYVGPVEDLEYLAALMEDADEDVARDAYSHWCAGTSHGVGYATLDEAKAAAV